MTGVFVPPARFIPGKNMTLAVGTIRGVESRGMLVSEFELQISDDHEGIIDLPADAPVGQPYAKYAGLDDAVIDINLTPNRPDCTGVNGVARDLAAADVGTFKERAPKPVKGEFPCPVSVKLDFGQTHSLCPAFALRLVRGVKNGPSPEWLQKRLKAIGLRPINALVDITNFITYDRGRPLHVFDANKVKGNLVVRRAQNGEQFVALDGKTYTLDNAMCVIADDNGVESLAGIMGGEASGCDENTTDVLIESALWEPLNIAQTGRKLGINSDARYRFERGVDPNFMVPGLELATKMVIDLCGGTPSEITVAGKAEAPEKIIDFPTSELKRLAGLDLNLIEMRRVLTKLGFFVAGQDSRVKVAAPSWRPDIEGKADIVEEIVRIVGVDRIPSTPFDRGDAPRKPVLTTAQVRTRKAKRALARARPDRGRDLVVHFQAAGRIVRRRQARTGARQSDRGRTVRHAAEPHSRPRRRRAEERRPRLPRRGAVRGRPGVQGRQARGSVHGGDRRAPRAGQGRRHRPPLVEQGGRPVDAFDAKADALAVLAAAGAPAQAMQVVPGGPAWFHPGRSGTIQIGPQNVLGHFGELHPRALEALDAEGPLVAFEVILERIPEGKAKATRAKPVLELSPFQPVTRDFAFVVDRAVKAADIVRAAQNVDRKLIAGVSVFDVYEGQGIEAGKKSVAIAVTIQPREKTMTDQEIDALGGQDRGRGEQAHRRRAAGMTGKTHRSIPPRPSASCPAARPIHRQPRGSSSRAARSSEDVQLPAAADRDGPAVHGARPVRAAGDQPAPTPPRPDALHASACTAHAATRA